MGSIPSGTLDMRIFMISDFEDSDQTIVIVGRQPFSFNCNIGYDIIGLQMRCENLLSAQRRDRWIVIFKIRFASAGGVNKGWEPPFLNGS